MDDAPVTTAAMPPAEADALVVAHLPLVRRIAAQLYRFRWNSSVEFKEYCQMGALGLVEAAQRFDPARGVAFGSFASWRISGAILNGLASSTELHQQVASRKRRVDDRVRSLSAEPPPAERNLSLEASLARISSLAMGLAVGFMLEDTGMFDDGQGLNPLDGYANLALRQWRERLRAAVLALPEQEAAVLQRHYFQQQAFVDIAVELGLTKGRISQIHKAGVERLRQRLTADNADFEA
jgi:RNA polymerase sigma factor for flagellar operon FliA